MQDALYLGIDIGTSSAKCVVIDGSGQTLASGRVPYDLNSPRERWAEQDPETWRKAVVHAIRQAVGSLPGRGRRIAGIGMTGQMHGLVMLDADLRPLKPAIIWPDARSTAQVERIQQALGQGYIRRTGGPVCTGFLLSSLLWVKDMEPWIYRGIHRVLPPKDYVRLWLTGGLHTDPTDACGTGAFDPSSGDWAGDILDVLALDKAIFPDVKPSALPSGALSPEAAADIGLQAGLPVVTGCGDLQASAVGAGIASLEQLLINIGTGGQVFKLLAEFTPDLSGRTHTMTHADGTNWNIMSAVLSAGLSVTWFARLVGGDDDAISLLFNEAAGTCACAQGLFFLPYLLGERTPGGDISACFVGLRLKHGRRDLFRAILEGVTFSLLECCERIQKVGQRPKVIRAGGGGLKNEKFRQLVADAFGLPVEYSEEPNASALGAALLAHSGVAEKPLARVLAEAQRVIRTSLPNTAAHSILADMYAKYRDLVRDAGSWQHARR